MNKLKLSISPSREHVAESSVVNRDEKAKGEIKDTDPFLGNIFKDSLDPWQITFDSVSDGIFILDANHKILRVNKAMQKLIGKKENDIYGCLCWEVIHGTDTPLCNCPAERMRKSLKRESVTIQNKEICYEITVDPILDNQGNLTGIIHIVRDITEKKNAEERMFQIKQNWEDTFNSITDMVTIHDKDYNIIHANKAAEKILGLPFLHGTKSQKCFKHYHGTEKPPKGCPSCKCLITGSSDTFELFEPHLNMFIEIRAIPRFDSSGNLIGLIHIVRDISEQKEFEDKLKRLNTQLQDFTSHLQKIREEERASIARDIHDEMGQNLTALKLELSLIKKELESSNSQINKSFLLNEVNAMKSIVNNSIENVRELIRKLRPEVLDHLGLVEALKWQAAEFEKRTRIKCGFKANRKSIKVSKDLEITLFRIVQEALTNILKHANASEIKININKMNGKLNLNIIDNGKGFKLNNSMSDKNYGLIGMNERASKLGGELEINTKEGKGTILTVSIPFGR